MKLHPVVHTFRKLTDEEYKALRASIVSNRGCTVPVVRWRDQIIDGRNRVEICEAEGLPFPISDVDFETEEEAVSHAWTLNRDRRHATPAELAMSGAEMVTLLQGIAEKRMKSGTLAPEGARVGKSTKQAAEIVGSTRRAVEKARTVTTSGTPSLKEAVADGTVSLTDAAKVASEPAKVQEKAVEAVRAGTAKTATQAAANGKPVKPGKPHFDDRPFNVLYGKMIRFFDDRRSAFGKGPRDHVPHHADCIEAMECVKEAWDKWHKETT